jgi:glycosyltransferase involved in cell wall biosynthesis
MRILQITHGYPPRENAGTERHTQQLVQALSARGHEVHVLSATRAPGRPQYSKMEEPGITRLVNNISARPLAQAEQDRAVDTAIDRVVRDFNPDLVHIQHVQFLSSEMRFPCPSVLTMHDQWGWCASGGLGIRRGQPCEGPAPARCAPCHADWRPTPSKVEQGLTQVAGGLSPWIAPERLHKLYRTLPPSLRTRARRGQQLEESQEAAAHRNEKMAQLFMSVDIRVSPSEWLARQAREQGLGPVEVIPHGTGGSLKRRGGGPLTFIGSIAHHKGPDLVVQAWRDAFEGDGPGLDLYGPLIDPDSTAGHPVSGPLERHEVWEILADAQALVMGSRWPENAPLVIVEARAAGCPVIAPRIGGIPELIEHGCDGLLYEPGDAHSLSEAMRELVQRPWTGIRTPPSHEEQVEATLSLYQRLVRA